MKRNLLITSLALLSSSLLAAEPKDDVASAAKNLAGQDNYSWPQPVKNARGRGFGAGAPEGKIEKGGPLWLSMTMRDNTIEAVKSGEKGAIKTQDGWVSLADAANGDRGPAMFMARRLQNFKGPAAQAEALLADVKELKQQGDLYEGDLTEQGAKSQLTFGRRGGNGPEVSGAQGSAQFWVKDGQLSKFAVHVKGTVSFNGNDRDVDRTTTVEIKNVGSTKIEVPGDAKQKMQ